MTKMNDKKQKNRQQKSNVTKDAHSQPPSLCSKHCCWDQLNTAKRSMAIFRWLRLKIIRIGNRNTPVGNESQCN